jgi:hypothetical protein
MASNYKKEPIFCSSADGMILQNYLRNTNSKVEMLKQRSALIAVLSGWNFS